MESRLCRVPCGVHSRCVVSFRQARGSQPDSASAMATAMTRWPRGPLLANPALLAQEAQRRAARLASAGVIRTRGPAGITPGRTSGGVPGGRPPDGLAPAGPAGMVVPRRRARLATAAARTRLLRITGTTPLGATRGGWRRRVSRSHVLLYAAEHARRVTGHPGAGAPGPAGTGLHPPRAMASRPQRAGMPAFPDITAWPATGGGPGLENPGPQIVQAEPCWPRSGARPGSGW